MLAHGLTAGAAFSRADEAVVVDVKAGKGLFGAGLGLGDDDRSARLQPGHAVLTATTVHRTSATISAGFAPMFAAGVKLGTTDGPVVIGVQPIETGIGATGHPGLHGGAALVGRDRAVAIGVDGGEAL